MGLLVSFTWFQRENHPQELYAYGVAEAVLHYISLFQQPEMLRKPQLIHTYTPQGELMLIARGSTAQALTQAGIAIEQGWD